MFARVVSAEEKLATSLELNAKVGLRTASVTAIRSAQRGSSGGNGSCHFGLNSLHRCLWSNVATGSKIPPKPCRAGHVIQSCSPYPLIATSMPRNSH